MMEPDEDYIATMGRFTPREKERFEDMTAHLERRIEATPYHSGGSSLGDFEAALKLAGNPHQVLEVGFCMGHSASMFLSLGVERIYSVDNSLREQTIEGVRRMRQKYDGRFFFIRGDALHDFAPLHDILKGQQFDLMFIDGGHEYLEVVADIKLGKSLGITRFLFDDFFPHWGPGVQPALHNHKLRIIAILGGMAYCET